MNSFEAVLHYGMTRSDPPTAEAIRGQFFACVISGGNMGGDMAALATALMATYVVALEAEDEDGERSIELLDGLEAEQAFRKAYEATYYAESGANEVPDGLGTFDFVEYKSVGLAYPMKLMVDVGHLLAFFEISQQKAVVAYFKSEEGRRRLRAQGIELEP